MNGPHSTLLLVVVLVTMPVAASTTGAAEPTGQAEPNTTVTTQQNSTTPETASAYLSTFRRLNGTAAFRTYSEFEIIRSQAVFAVQVGEFTPAEQRRMALLLDLLRTFRKGYALQQNGSYGAAIEAANETTAISDRLRRVDGGERYALLAEIALERFYSRTGQSLQSSAEAQDTTPQRIRTLRRAALAYQQAGATDRYSRVLLRSANLSTTYRADVARMNDSAAAAASFVDRCQGCASLGTALTANRLAVFTRYRQSRSAVRQTATALALARKHGLDSRAQKLTALRTRIERRESTLAVASTVVLAGYAVLIGLFAALVAWRLTVWRTDLEAAAQGDSILVGEMLRG